MGMSTDYSPFESILGSSIEVLQNAQRYAHALVVVLSNGGNADDITTLDDCTCLSQIYHWVKRTNSE